MRRPEVFTLDYSHPLAHGLVSAGIMQMPGTAILQDALLRNNIQLVNMEMSDWSSDDAGRVSLKFGGTDERAETSAYVVQPSNAGYSEFPTLGVAMSVWFRPSSVATNQTIFCLGGYNSYRRARFRFLGAVTGDPVSFEHKGSVAGAELVSASGLNGDTQTWHHLYAYFRNTYREFWLDGRFVGSDNSGAGSGSTNSPLCLGCYGYATTRTEFFTGELADPLVWVREINPHSTAEIALLADRTDPMLGGMIVEERPVLWFPLTPSGTPYTIYQDMYARISWDRAQTQDALAKISTLKNLTQDAKVSVSMVYSVAQDSFTAVSEDYLVLQDASATISEQVGYVVTQDALAQIHEAYSKVQDARAAVSSEIMVVQDAQALISEAVIYSVVQDCLVLVSEAVLVRQDAVVAVSSDIDVVCDTVSKISSGYVVVQDGRCVVIEIDLATMTKIELPSHVVFNVSANSSASLRDIVTSSAVLRASLQSKTQAIFIKVGE